MSVKCFVAYYRVSTDRQGNSGLGLEAQKKAVLDFLSGDTSRLIDEFVEVESGSVADRPQLQAALRLCRKSGAGLIIGKLDRLSRSVAFIAGLLEGGIEFIACDMPQANKLTIHIMAAMAEHEREAISQRTKAALAAARDRGVLLGTRDGRTLSALGTAALKRQAQNRAATAKAIIGQLQLTGIRTYKGLAEALNARGVQSPRGSKWYAESVRRALL